MIGTPVKALQDIPQRPALPLLGHALGIPGGADGLLHLIEEAKRQGPIFRLNVFGTETLVVSGPDLVAELSDETRFRKNIVKDMGMLRDIGGDGLFTANDGEANWRKAHDVLLPAFSLGAMRGYHDTMLGVANSLIATWDAAGRPVDVPDDMTKLTLDTIGLCGFGTDFESFTRPRLHPFLGAMGRALSHIQREDESLPGLSLLRFAANDRYRSDLAYMKNLVDEVIAARRGSGDASQADLLGRMLHVRDPRTGELLDDENIRYQVLTFLIAGHETTSGALSFALYYLLKHPEVLARAQSEVDALWAGQQNPQPSYEDVGRLTYVRQVLNEALRLWPTAPAYAVEPVADTVLGGRYIVRRGEVLMILTPALHRDDMWGDNPELFDPERFDIDREEARPVHVFKPFGSGERACIGRQFALHEATLLLGMLIHRYRFLDHGGYQLKIKQSLTIKPDEFRIKLVRRGAEERRVLSSTVDTPVAAEVTRKASGTALTVLYGSNLGTCSGLAAELLAEGEEHGFTGTVSTLDSAIGKLTEAEGPVLIVAASYNGKPTDDAAGFAEWVAGLEPGALEGVRYAVLGIGDRNWAATYQQVPRLLAENLDAAGAVAVLPRGAADASGDFAGAVDRWTAELWAALLAEHGVAETAVRSDVDGPLYTVDLVGESATEGLLERHGLREATVLDTGELSDMDHPLGRSKRFLRIQLPTGMTYRTGDHLAVLPENPADLVRRAAERFGLQLDRTVRLGTTRRSRQALPVDRPITLRRLLTEFVELQDPATPEQVRVLAEHTACPPERRPLEQLTAPIRATVLELLERYRACELPFPLFLEMLPALRPRHYSISSSALSTPDTVELMVSLLAAPHRDGDGTFRGIASHHLGCVRAGDVLAVRVNPCRDAFRLPEDDTPVIMVSAGTGLAPFRGAILDRVHVSTGATLLNYFGCDHPEVDYLHRAELESAEATGVVRLRPAFSQAPVDGVRFVQHAVARDAAELWPLLEQGARIYVCGDGSRMAPGVRQAFVDIYREQTGADEAKAEAWLLERYTEDVWAQ
ncbi:cytochrome P450 [Pseudonocardiaceae bacterium YIM PH 21723]|nr:cytochrome P450 [Pseudonocardiaceae bacterium YIM PH 21723]